MSVMNTFYGRTFDPMEMTEENVALEDIARALSLLCRGGGHIRHFYSVAQHSINCAKEAKARELPERMQLACLLHDASEAYISDIIRPVKEHLNNYLEIEAKIMAVIWKHFHLENLTEEEQHTWKEIDDAVLVYEFRHLMTGSLEMEAQELYSEPDVSERNWREIETEFQQWAERLICR